MKKLRKKKEEKGEEESDKDRCPKATREPQKKKESPAPRSRVAKVPKKPQGEGGGDTAGSTHPHHPWGASAAALHAPGVLFVPKIR